MEATHPGGNSPTQRTFIKPTPHELERGAKQCVKLAREQFGQWLWAFRNLPKEQFQAVCALATLLHLAHSAIQERKDVPRTEAPCDQLREDLSDAFVGRFASAPLYFLADVVARYRIPKQFIFEPLEAFDRHWRFGQPANEQEMLATATRLGGALMRQLVHVLGYEQPGFEQAALKTGQGLTLTWWLLHLADDVRADKLRLSKSDFTACHLKPEKVLWPEPSKELNQFVRLYAQRIDHILAAGSSLYQHLNYDGQRVLRTLLGIGWKALSNARLNPSLLRESDGAFSDSDLFKLKARQFLGLDAPLPFASDDDHHH
jgi:phytoene/squalene synthetase